MFSRNEAFSEEIQISFLLMTPFFFHDKVTFQGEAEDNIGILY